MNPEQGPSEEDKNFKAPETSSLSDHEKERQRIPQEMRDRIDVAGESIRKSNAEIESQRSVQWAERYREEAKKASSAKERYELTVQARAEEFFADNPEGKDTVGMLRAFEEENPQLFEEWKKVTGQMTPEQVREAEETVRNIKVS